MKQFFLKKSIPLSIIIFAVGLLCSCSKAPSAVVPGSEQTYAETLAEDVVLSVDETIEGTIEETLDPLTREKIHAEHEEKKRLEREELRNKALKEQEEKATEERIVSGPGTGGFGSGEN